MLGDGNVLDDCYMPSIVLPHGLFNPRSNDDYPSVTHGQTEA